MASASELSADIRRIGLELRDFDLNEETDEIEGSPGARTIAGAAPDTHQGERCCSGGT